MNISVKELTSVDKELTLTANREDLQESFDKAFKNYKNKIALPGFRPGRVPVSVVKKRFGSEIELEEINKWVQTIFENKIIPEHSPVGETEMLDLKWEDDKLEVVFKIGIKPTFEITDLSKVKVNKMVHDVTDKEVAEELDAILEREGNWEDVDAKATADSKVIVDVISLDEEGNPIEGDEDTDQVIDLRQEGAKDFLKELKGKKVGDVVDMNLEDGDRKDRFRVTIKKIQKLIKAELNEAFIIAQSNGEANTEDEFNSFIKSGMQQYYDQTSDDLLKNDIVDALVNAHEDKIEVPEVFLEQVLNSYVDQLKQQQQGKFPANFDEVVYKEEMRERGIREAKWFFISQQLQETFDDIEINAEDIDQHISAEAARFGATAEQLKGYYAQNPSMLEQLRVSIRETKVFDKLEDEVKLTELSKDKYRELQEKKAKK
ncbi:MAG: trigger factor [Balneolaceae bacterium]